ncbi:MAG: SpoIIE family protein phosphatase [Anaerolineales bacterium]|nr:SpoIIE family protein phosphatase [Anaerolineales bacterium]
MSPSRSMVGVGDTLTVLYTLPILAIGLGWLYHVSDFSIFQTEWKMILLFAVIIALFSYLNFFMIIEFREDRYGSAEGAFNSMAVWAAAFIFGPTTLWIMVCLQTLILLFSYARPKNKAARWNDMRDFLLTTSGFTIPYLVGLQVYQTLGGVYPLPSLDWPNISAASLAIIVNFLVFILIWLPYFLYALFVQKTLTRSSNLRPITFFFIMALAMPTLAHPFAILAAGLYTNNGLFSFNFFIIGLFVISILTRQFSHTAESNRQQTRQLEKLESLGRAILSSPPDMSTLPEILAKHVPNMFTAGNVIIWVIPGQILYKSSHDWEIDLSPIWDWGCETVESQSFAANSKLPWNPEETDHRPIVFTPVLAQEGQEVIGGIYMELRQLAQPWNKRSLRRLYPAVQNLADQIASAIYRSEEYARSIALEKVSQEIQIAGQIQASFLPNQFPNLPGWQLAVTLEPAGGLSGDFFDLIPLSNGRLGLVIADVTDKGIGAALYMALCRTLIRTYAFEYQSRPDLVISEANERILQDARANLFITCFYGVLDPREGTLTYVNAGHNPPILTSNRESTSLSALARTGMPMGIEEDASWERRTISFTDGDKLILYTDGVTEAQNEIGATFDEQLLIECILKHPDNTAFQLQEQIMKDIKSFVAGAPQFDDITLMILEKELQNHTLIRDPAPGNPLTS